MTAGGFVGFTDAEKQEIEAALAAEGLPTRDSRFSLDEHLEFIAAYCSGAYADPRIERRRCKEGLAKLNKEIKIIERTIDIHLSYKDEHASSGADTSIIKVDSLRDLLWNLEDKRYLAVRILDSIDPMPGNNYRPFQDGLQSYIASIWISAGGEVNGHKEYRRFFEALARPILTNRRIRADHNVAWAESTFADHVNIIFDRIPPF
jgi:hypothetical protein